MKLVTCMGSVWRLTDASYRKLTQFIAAGGTEVNLADYGTCLGATCLDVTDIDADKRDECRMLVPGYKEYDELQKVREQLGM